MEDRHIITAFIFSGYLVLLLCFNACTKEADATAELAAINAYIDQNQITAQRSGSIYYTLDTIGSNIGSEGVYPNRSSLVTAHIRGRLLDETVFGDSKSSAIKPLIIAMNQHLVEGLRQGMQLIPKGGKGTLYIPPSLAYGSYGDPSRDIPGDASVIYDVEILNVFENETAYNDTLITHYLLQSSLEADTIRSGLHIFIDASGDDVHPDANSLILLKHVITALDGTIYADIDATADAALINLDEAIAGLSLSLPLFGQGGRGRLVIPSQLAHGSSGTDTIPKYTPLIYIFELVEVIEQ